MVSRGGGGDFFPFGLEWSFLRKNEKSFGANYACETPKVEMGEKGDLKSEEQ